MQLLVRGMVAALALALMPRSAPGELIALDLLAAGDKLLTRDTVSHLEWLDPPATMGLPAVYSPHTYDEIESGAGGWRGLGFRHASRTEVVGLVLQFAFPEQSVLDGYGYGDELFWPAQNFLSMLGCTEACGTTEERVVGYLDDGSSGDGGVRGWLSIGINIYDNPHFPPQLFRGQLNLTSWYDLPGAHFLVRTVPEPVIFAMLSPLSLIAVRRLLAMRFSKRWQTT